VAANGVEDFRQKTPPNAIPIARRLLEAGAPVDALADTYGGGSAQTTMNLLVSSTHPAEAGLQSALVEVLLDAGAATNGLDDDGSPLMTALAFGYLGAAETLGRRGARVDNVVAAAGLGREDLVRRFVIDRDTLSPDVQYFETRWLRTPREPAAHLEMALVAACKFGHAPVAELLLTLGVDPAAHDGDRMTGLHWAAANGVMGLVEILIRHGAPLEARNQWGGTVLDSTAWFACHSGPGWPPVAGADFPAVMDRLIQAGADVGAVDYPTGQVAIDAVLSRYASREFPEA
jgi:ankyrin repeat protein